MAKKNITIDLNTKDGVLACSRFVDDDSETMNIAQEIFEVDAAGDTQAILLEGFGATLESLGTAGWDGSATIVIPQIAALRLFQILKLAKDRTKSVDEIASAVTLSWMSPDLVSAVRTAVSAVVGFTGGLRIVSALQLYQWRIMSTDLTGTDIALLEGKQCTFENSLLTKVDGQDYPGGISVRDMSYVTGTYEIRVNKITDQKGNVRYEGTIPRMITVRKADGTIGHLTGFEVSADMSLEGYNDASANVINQIRLHVANAALLPRIVTKKKIVTNKIEG